MVNMQIRHADTDDLDRLTELEKTAFPAGWAASKESIRKRLETFPDHFWVLEEDGTIVSFINGFDTDTKDLNDDMYDNASLHEPEGRWQMIFSVVTGPEYRHHGYAGKLMNKVIEDVKNEGRSGIVLTCEDSLISFYSGFGFVNEGLSESRIGGVKWNQMRLSF